MLQQFNVIRQLIHVLIVGRKLQYKKWNQ